MSPKTGKVAEWLRRSPVRRIVTKVKHRELSCADVFLASYPRSGNTWAMFMLMELLTGERVDMRSGIRPPSMFGPGRAVSMIGAHRDAPRVLPGGGRLIKTHAPYRSEYRRAIYLVRDVRDVAPSVFRLREFEGLPTQAWGAFLDDFATGRIGGWGSWQDHAASWLDAASGDADVLILTYEHMVDAPARSLGRMAAFIGLDESPERIQTVADNHAADKMRRISGQDERAQRLLMANATYGRWRDLYTRGQLSKLDRTMDVMGRLGYDVDVNP